MDRLKDLWARVQRTRLWQAWQRYSTSRGSLLAGGVTYFAFFSIFPLIALAFTVFGLVLQGNDGLLTQIKDYLNETLPGFVKEGDEGLIPIEAPSGDTLTLTGLVGVAGLLWAGLGWLSALREGIRGVFGVTGSVGNFVVAKLRDLGVLLLIGLAIVASAAVTGIASAATGWIAGLIGLGDQQWLLRGLALLIGAVLDGVVVLVMLRLLSGVDVPRRGLIGGAVVGGIGLTVLKLLGTTLIASTTGNPLFASVALVIGLLAWLNFMSRIVLLSAAWAANSLDPMLEEDLTEGQRAKLLEGPATPQETARDTETAAPAAQDTSGRAATSGYTGDGRHTDVVRAPVRKRADDRVTLALGATLGAAAATGLAAAAGILRRVTGRR
ncbi:membrane protein [Knoellia remsis]|uniref:Membrane protein n=1 Tax=Knoellia remsis TaxID=407159 RepID=A0A2T0UQB0_9MICO|nr:YihY/virulence factor BrkB family protein [Knoellia remsis]PRY60122.1 membrane protein [Knoellia remsis]